MVTSSALSECRVCTRTLFFAGSAIRDSGISSLCFDTYSHQLEYGRYFIKLPVVKSRFLLFPAAADSAHREVAQAHYQPSVIKHERQLSID